MKFLNEKMCTEFLNEVNLNQFVDTFGQPWEACLDKWEGLVEV